MVIQFYNRLLKTCCVQGQEQLRVNQNGERIFFFDLIKSYFMGWLPWWLSGKESACNAGDVGLIPGSGGFPGGGNGNPLQYSCLGNPMDTGVWWAIVHGLQKSRTRLSD